MLGRPELLFLLRAAIRSVLTTPMEGNMYQVLFLLTGTPGVGKSLIIELLRMFINSRFVRNFAEKELRGPSMQQL